MHRWVGLCISIPLFVLAASGGLLVLEHELDPMLYPERYRAVEAFGAEPSLERLYHRVLETYPDARALAFHRSGGLAYPFEVHFTSGTSSAEVAHVVSADPYMGTLFGLRGDSEDLGGNFFSWVLELHEGLHMGRWGRLLVGLIAIGLLMSIVSGIVYYRKHLWTVLTFQVRIRRANRQARRSALHRVIGVWTILFHLIIAVTGLWFSRTAFYPSTYATSEATGTTARPPEVAVSIDTLVVRAQEALPGFQWISISFPNKPGDVVSMYGGRPGDFFLYPEDPHVVRLDASTGAVDYATREQDVGVLRRIEMAGTQLHFGQYGGLPVKVLYVLLGLAAPLLSATGTWLWWQRRRVVLKRRYGASG